MTKLLELRLVRSLLTLVLGLFIAGFYLAQPALAQPPSTTPCNKDVPCQNTSPGVSASLPQGSSGCTTTDSSCLKDNPIVKDINSVVNFLSIGVGIIVTAAIIMGGIQYIMAGDNDQAVKGAKEKITNGFLALFAFLFLYALLQWLIPGGAFSS